MLLPKLTYEVIAKQAEDHDDPKGRVSPELHEQTYVWDTIEDIKKDNSQLAKFIEVAGEAAANDVKSTEFTIEQAVERMIYWTLHALERQMAADAMAIFLSRRG